MLKKRGRRRLWAVLGTMLLAAALGVCALAASDVPKAVLNARESVVRIMTEGAMGSGFALSENSVYVVTNHHVIEGAETIEVLVDDTRWTTARVYVDLPGKDICILKTDKPLRGMPGLPLRSDAVETGLAVYALGYPGAADDFSQEFATGVDSITVTDGIVSAVRQSRAEGLQTTWAIQTNAPISPGNSGGPLVDAGGRLVGINTFIMLEGQNVNGSIHVRELLTVLQQNDIPYRKAAPGFAGVLLVVLAVAAALGVCAALLLRLRRRGAASGKPMREKAVPLPVFLAGGGRMDRLRATRAVRELAQRLASIPEDSRALHPENILVRSGTLELKRNQKCDDHEKTSRGNVHRSVWPPPGGLCTQAPAKNALISLGIHLVAVLLMLVVFKWGIYSLVLLIKNNCHITRSFSFYFTAPFTTPFKICF